MKCNQGSLNRVENEFGKLKTDISHNDTKRHLDLILDSQKKSKDINQQINEFFGK